MISSPLAEIVVRLYNILPSKALLTHQNYVQCHTSISSLLFYHHTTRHRPPTISLIRHGEVGVVGAPPPRGHERRQLPVAELEPRRPLVGRRGSPAGGGVEPQLPLQLGELLGSPDHVVVADVPPAGRAVHLLVHADVRLRYPLHVRCGQQAFGEHGVRSCEHTHADH
jgi:hypothetical protein